MSKILDRLECYYVADNKSRWRDNYLNMGISTIVGLLCYYWGGQSDHIACIGMSISVAAVMIFQIARYVTRPGP